MSKWKKIIKKGACITDITDGNVNLEVGRSYPMGLGAIELRNTSRAGLHIIRFTGGKRVKYSLRLSRDGSYRLGPDYGHRVVKPDEEKDPIKRVLRKVGVPVTRLERVTSSITIDEQCYDNDHCPNGRPTHNWIHDGLTTIQEKWETEKSRGFFEGGSSKTCLLKKASFAIRVDCNPNKIGRSGRSRITQIVVWPTCQPGKLADAIGQILYGGEADRGFIEALLDAKAAELWLKEEYWPEVTVKGNTLTFRRRNSSEVEGFSLLFSFNPAKPVGLATLPGGKKLPLIGQLVERHGFSLLELPAEINEFLLAISDKDIAKKYLLSRYHLERHRTYMSFQDEKGEVLAFGTFQYGKGSIPFATSNGNDRGDNLLSVLQAHDWEFIQSLADLPSS